MVPIGRIAGLGSSVRRVASATEEVAERVEQFECVIIARGANAASGARR